MNKRQKDNLKPEPVAHMAHRAIQAVVDKSVSFDRSAVEALLRDYGINNVDFVLLEIENAHYNFKQFLESQQEPTQKEIAQELHDVANQIDRLSPLAKVAISMGTSSKVSHWRLGEIEQFVAHVRAVAEMHEAGNKAQYMLTGKPFHKRNYVANHIGQHVKYLAWIWHWHCAETDPADREVRVVRSITADGLAASDRGPLGYTKLAHGGSGFRGNKGADFVLNAIRVITGRALSYQTIGKHMGGAPASAWAIERKLEEIAPHDVGTAGTQRPDDAGHDS